MPSATIVVPTHDHHLTLPLAVRSALAQTVADIEVVVLGDGITPETRDAALGLAEADPRVVLLDLPKGEHRGEVHRDTAVRGARSEAIFYLCDDDLLLPRHVENLLVLLADHDLVQCRNGYVDLAGQLRLYPTDLSDPVAVAWHLRVPRRNCISLTGTAHRLDAYLALPEGWSVTPAGEWPDHYLWKKLLSRPGARAATHPEMTAVQLPTSAGRDRADQVERLAELTEWQRRLEAPDAHAWLQREVARVTPIQLDETHRVATDARLDLHAARAQLAQVAQDRARLRAEVAAARSAVAAHARAEDRLQAEVEALHASTSWRITRPARALGRALRGH